MKDLINSDVNPNPTMIATEKFNNILQQIQSSQLNFHLQISPYSAVISLKKSLMRDKSGNVILPSPTTLRHASSDSVEKLVDTIVKLEKDITDLTKKYEDAIDDGVNAHQIIEKLEKRQLEAQIKVEETESLNEKHLYSEIEKLKVAQEGRDEEIHNLRIANKSSEEVSEKLRLAMCESKDKFEKEKVQLVKDHKAEVKAWKRDLGEANSKVIKLEKLANKYEACSPNCTHTSGDSPTSLPSIVSETQPLKTQPIKSEIQCSICSVTIADYKPKYISLVKPLTLPVMIARTLLKGMTQGRTLTGASIPQCV